MKNKLPILFSAILFTFLIHASCKAQHGDNFSGTLTINDTIELRDAPQAVTAKFSQPNDTEVVFWEMKEVNVTRYFYNNGGEFNFVNNELISFKFTSSTYKLKLGTFELKVGNNISTLSSAFPNSYTDRGPKGTAIGLGTGDYQYLNIKTNSNDVITEIELRFIP